MLKSVANEGFADEIDGIPTVGFSADPAGDGQYLLIQKLLTFDEQEIRLGHDKPNF